MSKESELCGLILNIGYFVINSNCLNDKSMHKYGSASVFRVQAVYWSCVLYFQGSS